MDTLKKYKKHFLALAGAAVAGLGVYYLFKEEPEESPVKKQEKRKPGQPLQKHEKANLLASLSSRKHDIKNIETLKAIEDATIKLSAPDFYNLIHDYRKQRRACGDNYAMHVQLWEDYNKRLGEIMETARREILEMMDVRSVVFEDAKHQLNNEYTEIIIHLPTKLLEQIAEPKHIPLELYKDLFKFQIDFIPKLKAIVEELNKHVVHNSKKNPGETQTLVHSILYDKIFEKFNIEEEELFKAYYEYKSDPEVIQLSDTATMAMFTELYN